MSTQQQPELPQHPQHPQQASSSLVELVSKNSSTNREDILAVPKIWTKKAYQWCMEHRAVPRPWHLEGRWGSRTHQVDDERMGFPIVSSLSENELLQFIEGSRNKRNGKESGDDKIPQLRLPHEFIELILNVPGVEILKQQPYIQSKRARDNPIFDATIHAERERPTKRVRIDRRNSSSPRQPLPSASLSSSLPLPQPQTYIPASKQECAFTYAELFCGIGGFGVALDAMGGRCLMISELDETCREMYVENFPNNPPMNRVFGDIYQVKESEFPERGTLDLLVGGFPCQPFSNLSHQPGFKCEKGRGMLFQEIVRVLEYSQPKAFLVENVPGLRDMTEAFQHILTSFEQAGYHVESEVCNAKALTATTRKRLFFVGIRQDLQPSKGGSSFQFPYVPDLHLRAEHVIDYDELPDEELAILRLTDDTLKQLSTGRRWRPHSLAWPNRPLDTITSHYGNAVGRGDSQLVPCHAPHNPRRFSPRECARLMGFPDHYRMIPQKEHQGDMAYRKQFYRMFGNAVCPPIIAALAGAVLDHCHLSLGSSKTDIIDWTEKGLEVAISLSMASRRSKPVPQPMGCLPLTEKQQGEQQKLQQTP